MLFYYEDGGDNQSKITLILRFMFTMIGGIGDSELESSTQATIGHLQLKDAAIDTIPKINSKSVRIKFYAVMFTIITKYNAKSCFHPSTFIHFVMKHIKNNLSVYHDLTAAVPILLYNMLPDMVTWLLSTYEFNDDSSSLLLTLFKLALRSGYVLRAISLMVVLMNIELQSEKVKGYQVLSERFICVKNHF